MQRLPKTLTIGAALLCGSTAASPAAAGEGYFLGIGLPSLSLEGDFDGETIYINTRSAEVAPRWEQSTGYRITGGFRDEGFYYIGSYEEVDLDGTWLGLEFSGTYQSVFGEAAYLFLRGNLHPYIGGGIGLSRVDVPNGSTDGVGFGESRFRGDAKYRVQAGLLFDIGRTFSLDLQVTELFGEFSDLDGLADGELSGFDVGGNTYSLSMQYYFGL